MSDKQKLKQAKQEKREIALRANLKRRKQQARERSNTTNTNKEKDSK